MTTNSVSSFKLWDSLGNSCSAELFKIGLHEFEVYFQDFNDSVPRRELGGLGFCNYRISMWLYARKQDGFQEAAGTSYPAWAGDTMSIG